MNENFIVGHEYANESDNIVRILKRTKYFICVIDTDTLLKYRIKIRYADEGHEIAEECFVPQKWKGALVFSSRREYIRNE
jgi:hypothetical protein